MAWNPIDDPWLEYWADNASRVGAHRSYPAIGHKDTSPLKLNKNQPAFVSHDLLGSQEWSGAFYRYMRVAFEQAVDQAMGRVHWWQVPYILSRLGQDETINRQHLGALLAFRVGHVSWQVALEQFQCRAVYVKRLEQSIKRIYRAFC